MLAALLWLAVSHDARALDIALSFSGGFENRSDAVLAMERAAATWEAVLTDPITIQIDVREVSILDLTFGAQGATFVNGWQAGHWQTGQSLGIMDANLPDDAIHNLSGLDLRAVDVIGWDLTAPGDFNHDRTVDQLDYSLWTTKFGSDVQLMADGNRNGVVDAADYVLWRSPIGEQGAGRHLAIPEPSAMALTFVALTVTIVFDFFQALRRAVEA